MSRKNKKKAEASGPPGAPEWIVTFTDMISLLVTFFVLLMTFSSTEAHDRLQVEGFLSGTRGNIQSVGGHLAHETIEDDLISATDIRRGADQPHSRPAEELEENLEEMGQKKTDDHREVDLSAMVDGLQIVFGPECSFEPGSAEVGPELRKSLGEIARVMEHYRHLVVVEGFTDSEFRPTPKYPTAESLSLARALAAVDVMVEESDLTPSLLQVAGLGAERPRGDNGTLEGRLANRRVEIRVLALSKSRSDRYEALEYQEKKRSH